MSESRITRRRALKIVAGGALVATIVLPTRWVRPIVESIVVPAHAAASPPATTRPQVTVSTSTTFPQMQTSPQTSEF